MGKKSSKYEHLQCASGVLINFYGDFEPLLIESAELPLCIEEICERSARYLSTKLPKGPLKDAVCHITSLTLPMFGLIDPGHKLWMSPREKLNNQDSAYKFVFRIRFCIGASQLNQLKKLDHQTWEYLYLQLHDDFINDRFDSMYRKKLPRPKLLGFVVIEYFNPSLKQQEASPPSNSEEFMPSVTFFGMKKHLPKSERLNFKWPWPYFRLYRSVSEKVNEYGLAHRKNEFKHIFMNGILEEVRNYGAEEYAGSTLDHQEGDILVDPFTSRPPGIFFGTNFLCSIQDINNMSLQTTPNPDYKGRVQIQANGVPVNLLFKEDKMAESFVSCVDGYFRLGFDFYYSLSSQSSVEAPSLTLLNSLRAFGPMLNNEADEELHRHAASMEGDRKAVFLIHQSPTTMNEFLIVKSSGPNDSATCTKLTYDPKSQKFLMFVKEEDESETLVEFMNVTDLQRDLRKTARMIRPSKDCSLSSLFMNDDIEYYCKSKPVSTTRSTEPRLYQEDSIEIDPNAMVGQGEFTQVFKGQFNNFDDDDDQDCAIKQLKPGESKYSDHFQRGLCKLGKLQKHKIFIRLYGYMLAPPIRALLKYAVMGDLRSVMLNIPKPLTFLHIMSVLEHLAHGLVAMDERKEMHGNLRCQNLLVSQMTEDSLQVCIGDPGMESLYNTLPLTDKVNVERLPWIAVERFAKLSQITLQSEIYAFATTCWEMLTKGAHPKAGIKTDIIAFFHEGHRPHRPKRLDHNDNKELNLFKEELWELIEKCWESDPEMRPPLKDIQRSVYSLCDMAREQEGMVDGHESWANQVKFLADRHKNTLNTEIKLDHVIIHPSQLEIDDTESGKLGEGHYGEVRKAKYYEHSNRLDRRTTTSRTVAVKTTKNIKENQTLEFLKEIELACSLQHRNIVKVIGVCRLDGSKLVMEYVERGSLNKYLQKPLPLPTLAKFCLDVAEGMKYLHCKNVLHRDLAARNVLLGKNQTAKITDFGLSRMLQDKDYYKGCRMKEIPIHWCSPEAIERRYFTKKGDVWSYGVLMWEIFTLGKQKPHLVSDPIQLITALKTGQRLRCPDNCPPSFYTIMEEMCWKYEPEERADFQLLAFKVDECSRNLEAELQGK